MDSKRLVVGWREWVGLPALGLPVIKAKIDTGARTSALHAFDLETFKKRTVPFVRFCIHPLSDRIDVVVVCEAPVIDHRVVTDSGGNREKRYVIKTDLTIGALKVPIGLIELTLANRTTMSHRMLLGRNAMRHLIVDPANTFLLGRPKQVVAQYDPPQKRRRT